MPGVTAAGGFPVLSVMPGQFLLKDLVLLGAALWTLGDSLGAARPRARGSGPDTGRAGSAAATPHPSRPGRRDGC